MKNKLLTFIIASSLYQGGLLAQSAGTDSATLAKQQQELDQSLQPIDARMASRQKAWLEAQTKKVKYDTLGLGAYRADYAVLKQEKKNAEITFINKHPDYFASLTALNDVIGPLPSDIPTLKVLFNKLDKKIRQSAGGIKTKTMLDKFEAVSIGHQAPLFTSTDTAGHDLSLKSFRGKYLLLDFWASWCGPCREENPNVVAAYQKYSNRNFDILSVSLDQAGKKQDWMKAIAKDGLTWKHVSDLKYWSNAVAQLYMVRSIPQNFLIDPNGKIIAANLRGEALNQKLSELFNQ